MVHVLLTLNEPLLQRSRPRGPLGLSLTPRYTTLVCMYVFSFSLSIPSLSTHTLPAVKKEGTRRNEVG